MTDRLTPAAPASLTGVLLQGTAWMVAMRWGMSILGLISTTVLARLLTPEDFGLVAIAGAVIGLIFQNSGSGFAPGMDAGQSCFAGAVYCMWLP